MSIAELAGWVGQGSVPLINSAARAIRRITAVCPGARRSVVIRYESPRGWPGETVIVEARNIGTFDADSGPGSFKSWLLGQARWRIADQFQMFDLHVRQMSSVTETARATGSGVAAVYMARSRVARLLRREGRAIVEARHVAAGRECPRSIVVRCDRPGTTAASRFFTRHARTCIHQPMSQVLTVRIDPELLSRAEARAASLGLDRAGYVRGLIQQDLERPAASVRSRFASEDLVGAFRLGEAPATNQRVREQIRQRSRARR